MKNKAIAIVLLVFILGGIASEFGWVVKGNKSSNPKPKEKLIDSLKIDSLIIKIYKE